MKEFLIRQLNRIRESERNVIDKRHDSEKIHSLIWENIKGDSIIPLKARKRKKLEKSINTVVSGLWQHYIQ